MLAFEGFISHHLLVDQDAPGHLVVVAKWRTRRTRIR
jgi:heme-degrading monooxygenase HmoA